MSDRRFPLRRAPLPFRLLGSAVRAAGSLPGSDLAARGARETEAWLLGELAQRLDGLREEPGPAGDTGVASDLSPEADAVARFQTLLAMSLNQRPEDAHRYLFDRIVAQLVPDEARIIAALSDGEPVAVCHVGAGMRVGPVSRWVLENASTVGKDAGVMLLDQVPTYIAHLRLLGLVNLGGPSEALQTRYEILETDARVRDAVAMVDNELKMRPRLQRGTLVLSELGQALWRACETSALDNDDS